MNIMERVTISDGTSWPNPIGERYNDIVWKLKHNSPRTLTRYELQSAAEVMQAYSELITHPAFTLKKVQEKVSSIRKKIKNNL